MGLRRGDDRHRLTKGLRLVDEVQLLAPQPECLPMNQANLGCIVAPAAAEVVPPRPHSFTFGHRPRSWWSTAVVRAYRNAPAAPLHLDRHRQRLIGIGSDDDIVIMCTVTVCTAYGGIFNPYVRFRPVSGAHTALILTRSG
jgi:hypothetical protein